MAEDTGNQDDLILKQQEMIAKEIAASTDLISSKFHIGQLLKDFNDDEVYKKKAAKLGAKYSHFRRTRPDGNCFFRAVGFRYFEVILENPDELSRFRAAVSPTKDEMISVGMPSFTVEDFYENFMDTLDRLSGENKMSHSELLNTYNDEGISNYLVVFLRLLASKQLQKEGSFYENFMEEGRTISEFCATEVEPMYRESDHIHIIALSAAADLGVRVIYLDRGDGVEAAVHNFPEDRAPLVHLLYRPGHYDILYPSEST